MRFTQANCGVDAQRGESGGGLMRRVLLARWVAHSAQTGVNERPV